MMGWGLARPEVVEARGVVADIEGSPATVGRSLATERIRVGRDKMCNEERDPKSATWEYAADALTLWWPTAIRTC
ncbi:hypothetical protein TIFTF001_014126 [Ficus carica]|uniref:Uncharacterized protein n=1 Tax=Ficus carica TaxID=3494 RepID=A0AA88A368_FICCA|nr:hypothetical protein TIFTF001_014126 [Ficus carica]